jgi:hypothetical protein
MSAVSGCGRCRLSFLQHHFSGFDHGGDGVADFEAHLFGAASGNHALDDVVADFHRHVSHDVAQLYLGYFPD